MDRTLTSLKKIKDPFFRGQEFRMAETSQTNSELTKQKDKLLIEINKLSNIYFSLKSGSEKVKKDIVGFETDRIKTLEVLSKQVSLELDEEAEVLQKRSEELDEYQVFLEELSDYLSEFMPIVDSLCLDYEEKIKETEKMTIDTTKKQLKLKNLIKDYEEKVKKTKELLEDAKKKQGIIDRSLKGFQEDVKQKEKEWETKDSKLEIERKEIKSMKIVYKEREKKLNEKERFLSDRERYIRRLAAQTKVMI